MHRDVLRVSVCLSILMLSQGCGESAQEVPQPSVQTEFLKAADALAAKVGSPGANAEMPAASDPAVQAFEAQAEKALAALGTEALPVSGFESYEQLCGKTANIVGAYAMAGTSGTTGPAQAQKMEQNVLRHLDQMFTPLLFSAHCNALHLPFLEGQAAGMEGKADALKQVRDGIFGQVNGLIQMASDTTLAADRRRKIVDLLAADAPKFSVALSKGQRGQIVAAAEELQKTLPEEARPLVVKMSEAVQGAECGKICSAA